MNQLLLQTFEKAFTKACAFSWRIYNVLYIHPLRCNHDKEVYGTFHKLRVTSTTELRSYFHYFPSPQTRIRKLVGDQWLRLAVFCLAQFSFQLLHECVWSRCYIIKRPVFSCKDLLHKVSFQVFAKAFWTYSVGHRMVASTLFELNRMKHVLLGFVESSFFRY